MRQYLIIASALLLLAVKAQSQESLKKHIPDTHQDTLYYSDLKEVTVNSRMKYNTDNVSPSLRLQTPLVKIPQNIQVVGRKVLNDQQIFDLFGGVERNVSGVRRSVHQETYASLNIRGFMIKGLRNGLSTAGYFGPLKEDVSYVEKIEFVKGPGGFMLANGEPGGFYNVVTKKPEGYFRNSAALTTASFGTYRAETDNQGKFSDKVWYRLNVMGQTRGSHIDYKHSNDYAVAPVIVFAPDDKTKLTLEYNHQYTSFSGFNTYVYSLKGFKDAPRNRSYLDPSTNPINASNHDIFFTLNRKINDNWQLTAQSSYLRYKMRGEDISPVFNDLKENGDVRRRFGLLDVDNYAGLGQVFVNGKIQTGSVTHKILTGIDAGKKGYYANWSSVADSQYITPFNIYNPGDYLLTPNQIPQTDRSVSLRNRAGYKGENLYTSVYMQDELGFFNDRLRLTLAGRYTLTQRRDYKKTGFTDNKVFTPRIAISYSYVKAGSLYALYDQSFVENYGNLENGDPLRPSRGTNIELGIKKDFFDGRLSAVVSAFQITKTNLASAAGTADRPFSVQIGEARSRGVEADVSGTLFPQLDVVLNYAYTDAKVSKDAKQENIGRRLPGSAKQTANSWLSYRFNEQSRIQGFGLAAGMQWQRGRASFPFGENILPDDYFSLDAGVSYVLKGLDISLLINNITNNYNYHGAFPGAWGYKHYLWQTDPGINYRLKIGYTF